MAFTFDELENNPFFSALETKYVEKYKEAQKKLWIICVPCHKSIKGLPITKEFINSHILKPSPFFKSHFVTTDANNSSSFEIEDGNIKTCAGSIKILMEETAYNKDYKPYKMFIIERPLSSLNKIEVELQPNSCPKFGENLSLNECTTFLMSFPECTDVMKELDNCLSVFNSSYMVLPEYLEHAANRLQGMHRWAAGEFLRSYTLEPNDHSRLDVAAALENYIMFHVHDKVFPVIKKRCLEEDRQLTQKLLSLYESQITPDQLGIHESFCCPTPSAIVELASLNSRSSPAEKLHCLMTTLELLNKDIENFLSETCNPVKNKDDPRLTSDDLIPLLVYVIVQSRPQYFVSNLHYMQNFCWDSAEPRLSFSLVTFQAAKEFLKSNEFTFLKPSSRKIKKELSLEELMGVTVELENNSKTSSETKLEEFESSVDLRSLEKVYRMLEETSGEQRKDVRLTTGVLGNTENNINKTGQQENVGDFLSSMRQLSLGLSYGKQS